MTLSVGKKGRPMEEHTQQSLVIYAGVEKITILQDDWQQMVWVCVTVCVCQIQGWAGCAQLCGNEREN